MLDQLVCWQIRQVEHTAIELGKSGSFSRFGGQYDDMLSARTNLLDSVFMELLGMHQHWLERVFVISSP